MKVLIVDDETFVRVSFKSYINWHEYGFELVGEATNGIEALEAIDRLRPDIVFLDIKMPEVNGIEVLRELKDNKLSLKVIVLSSYNEFDYVREAMKLGAADYIHKPDMSEDMVLMTLKNVSMELQNEREHMREYKNLKNNIEQNKNDLKAIFLKGLIDEFYNKKCEVEEKVKTLGIKFNGTNMVCLAISIDNYTVVKDRYKANNKHLLDYAIKNIIDELFLEETEFEFFKYNNNMYMIVKSYSNMRSLNDIYKHNNIIANTTAKALKQFLNISTSIGISSTHKHIMNIPQAFSEAVEANRLKFYEHGGTIINYYDLKANKNTVNKFKIEGVLSEFRELIDNNEMDMLKEKIQETFEVLKEKRALLEKELKDFSKEILYIISGKYRIATGIIDAKRKFSLRSEELNNSENIFEIRDILIHAVDQLAALYRQAVKVPAKNSRVRDAMEYINSNYNRKLALETIAHQIGLNSSYLSRLFKTETGIGINCYINQVRIEMSKELLLKEDYKNYEVAEMVGYNNVEYFNEIFKRITGKSPKEYKNDLI